MSTNEVLFTGYSGFLGKNYLNILAQNQNSDIYLLGRKQMDDDNYKWSYFDIEYASRYRILQLRGPCPLLVHFAAKLPHQGDNFETITEEELGFLDACKSAGIKRVVFASTGGVYGYKNNSDERDTPKPNTPYAKYKLIIENRIRKLWPGQCLIVRLFFPYGPEQDTPRLIPSLINKIKKKEIISIQGNNGITLNPVFYKDALTAIEFLLNNNINGTYNIAGRECLSLRNIIEIISVELGKEAYINIENGVEDYLTGSTKLLLSINPQLITTNFREGISETITKYCGVKNEK